MYIKLCMLILVVLFALNQVEAATPIKPTISKVKECNVGADCRSLGKAWCCVSKTRPIGRKKRSLTSSSKGFEGTCKPMGRKGDNCLIRNQKEKINGIFLASCPCIRKCVADGNIDIPLGPEGICS